MRDVRSTVSALATLGLTTSVVAPLTAALSLLDEEWPDPLIRAWARGILASARVDVRLKGLENLPSGRFVAICNHQSNVDSLLLLAHVPTHLRFIAKEELFRIPVFGHAMRAMGNIAVSRAGGARDVDRVREAIEAVRQRVSIVVFAEGTRSSDGRVGPFKRGGPRLAIQAQVPLVPMAIAGTRHIQHRTSVWIRGGLPAALAIGKPMPTVGLSEEDRHALTDRARDEVVSLLAEAEALAR